MKHLQLLALAFALAGCLSFGEDWSTSSPTMAQVSHAETYCHVSLPLELFESIQIEWNGSGIDDGCSIKLTMTEENYQLFCEENGFDANLDEITRSVNAIWTLSVDRGERLEVTIESFNT